MSLVPRKRHRKARTGCKTCKSRRVKCDETFPACLRCVKLGQVCDGYGIWGGGGAMKIDISTCSTSAFSGSTLTIPRSRASIPGLRVSSEEQYYLEWFIHGTSASPPRIFNSSFWDPAILQATSHSPMILQVLLALSAAHKRHVLDPLNRSREGLAPDAHEIFLLRHYGRALKGLQTCLDEKGRVLKEKHFVAATTCSLLVLVDLMRARFDTASLHLQSGTHIAAQIPPSPRASHQLTQFYIRLRDQTAIFQHRSAPTQSPPPSAYQLRFSSSTEAAQYLDDLVEQVAFLAEQVRGMQSADGVGRRSRALHREVCRYLMACFEAWGKAYHSTVAEQRLGIKPTEAAAYEALLQRWSVSVGIAERCVGG